MRIELSLGLAIALAGCGDDAEGGSSTGQVSSSGADVSSTGDGSSSGSGSTSQGSSSGEGSSSSSSTSSSGVTASDTDDPSDSDTDADTDTGSAGSDCEDLGGTLVESFSLAFETHSASGVDVAVEPQAPLCLFPDGDGWLLRAQWGEQMGLDWESLMRMRVPGPGTYDLATDFVQDGPASLSYSRTQGPETVSYDTDNTTGTGTLQVDAWPTEATDPISVQADGSIGGWEFVFTLTANDR